VAVLRPTLKEQQQHPTLPFCADVRSYDSLLIRDALATPFPRVSAHASRHARVGSRHQPRTTVTCNFRCAALARPNVKGVLSLAAWMT